MGFAVGGANSVGVFLARTALSHSLVRGHKTGLSGCGVHIYPANIYVGIMLSYIPPTYMRTRRFFYAMLDLNIRTV